MKTKTAQEKSIAFVTKKVQGITVWPISYGVQTWLVARKNKVAAIGQTVTDFDCAEFCFAFTQDPLKLQSITGAAAKKQINELLMRSSMNQLTALYNYGIEQFVIQAKTMPVAKKKQATAKPKARKRAAMRR